MATADQPPAVELVTVSTSAERDAARVLVTEYLKWVAGVAQSNYGLSFDVDAMVTSDLEERDKFYPPTGRFYLVRYDGNFVGVGCLKRWAPGVGEVQRMYVQPHVRGVGAGRALISRLISDGQALGYGTIRLESLKALSAAHALYASVGFREVDPYSENSMKDYQPADTLSTYRNCAVFMELKLGRRPSDA
jgi:GNAT superfamily N-acetyltransferase